MKLRNRLLISVINSVVKKKIFISMIRVLLKKD